MIGTIEMRTKGGPLLANGAALGETEDLISSAISQHRPRPTYKTMEAPSSRDLVTAWPEI